MGVALVCGREVQLVRTINGYQWRGDDARVVAAVTQCVPTNEYDERGHPAVQLLKRVEEVFQAPTHLLLKRDGNRQSLRQDQRG
jgi:hypothetical protein